jgi:hypothetical protein
MVATGLVFAIASLVFTSSVLIKITKGAVAWFSNRK